MSIRTLQIIVTARNDTLCGTAKTCGIDKQDFEYLECDKLEQECSTQHAACSQSAGS